MRTEHQMSQTSAEFSLAMPVWLKDKETQMNVQAGFVSTFNASAGQSYFIRITGATFYRIFVNGSFIHYGPARAPHGYTRVDEIELTPYLTEGANRIAIEAAGYHVYTYYTVLLPSFIQAELVEDGRILRATGRGNDFTAIQLSTRVQTCMRYSFQRHFSEIYELDGADCLTNWRLTDGAVPAALSEVQLQLGYLPREVPVPQYGIHEPVCILEKGTVEVMPRDPGNPYAKRKFIDPLTDAIRGYPLDQIKERPFELFQDCRFTRGTQEENVPGGDFTAIGANQYVLWDMGYNNTGFIQADLYADEDSDVYFLFDEKLIDGKLDVSRWLSINIVHYRLKRGESLYRLESFEAYGFRYIQCVVLRGSIRLKRPTLREYAYPRCRNTAFTCSDERINRIYEAAVQTYRQNTVDVFMDCPTRERAGWLCDSYFTAQVSPYFSGEAVVEKVMLDNYRLAPRIPFIPEGMLPACYPADSPDGRYIPQWAMWYVIELEGYWTRNKEARKEDFKDLCYKLIRFLDAYKNSDGLLERLDKWNFIEWSEANDWVQDVNYPTNMLYSKVLQLVGTWYDDPALIEASQSMKAKILEQSFDGSFFVDNAVRNVDGTLAVTRNRSEVCQYYALFFQIADPQEERFAKLYDTVLHVFGPTRKKNGIMPEIAYANAFIGNFLRLELLLRWRFYAQALREIVGYYDQMAERTGTLWEHDDVLRGSLNHGFASYVGVAIIKCLLGVQSFDPQEGHADFDFADMDLTASGTIATKHGDIKVCRYREHNKTRISYSIPEGAACSISHDDTLVINRN